MKRLALTILARTLTDTDVRRLRDLFTAMDLNKDGRIDAGDLHDALDKVRVAALLLQRIMHARHGAWCWRCLTVACVSLLCSAFRAAAACTPARPTCSTTPTSTATCFTWLHHTMPHSLRC